MKCNDIFEILIYNKKQLMMRNKLHNRPEEVSEKCKGNGSMESYYDYIS